MMTTPPGGVENPARHAADIVRPAIRSPNTHHVEQPDQRQGQRAGARICHPELKR